MSLRRRRHILPALCVALAALASSHCGSAVAPIHVLLVDFDSASPLGLEIWKVDSAGIPLQLGSRLEFHGTIIDATGVEMLGYVIYNLAGATMGPLYAEVLRDPARPRAADLTLLFDPGSPGLFRAFAYNEVGYSRPSKLALAVYP